ncbi:hypothetical protein D3C75_718490 [compost metagenome]
MSTLGEYINELELLTAEIVRSIDQIGYEQLAAFSEQREQLVFSIESQIAMLTPEYKQRLQKLSGFDKIILSKMEYYRQDASEWLAKQGTIKVQKNAYTAHYSANSMFFDRKN